MISATRSRCGQFPFLVIIFIASTMLYALPWSLYPNTISAQADALDSETVQKNAINHQGIYPSEFSIYVPAMIQAQDESVQRTSISILQNGGFEEGSAGWSQFSTNSQTLIQSAESLAVSPNAGQWAVRLGGLDDEVSMVSQAVSVPDTHKCLVYWYWVDSSDSCDADYGGIGKNGAWAEEPMSLCAGTSTARWVQRSVDLSAAFTSSTEILNFAVVNDYSVPSTMYVDDVSFEPTEVCLGVTQAAANGTDLHTSSALERLIGLPITQTQTVAR